MRKIYILLIFLAMVAASFAATCDCNSCASCTQALGNASCDTIRMNQSITTSSDCISNPANFSNKIFNCQNYSITALSTGLNGLFLWNGSNFTIKNCTILYFGNGILLNNVTGITVQDSNITSSAGYPGTGINSTSSVVNLYNNFVCGNTISDLYSPDWLTSSGSENSCDQADGWSEDVYTHECTYYCAPDTNPPNVTLNAPSDTANINYYPIHFNASAVDDLSRNMSCSLLVDGTVRRTMLVSNGSSFVFNFTYYPETGSHFWRVICKDRGKNRGYGPSYTSNFNFTTNPGTCECYDKETCTDALNVSVCLSVILMNNVTQNGTFISYLTNFQNKNFSCQNNVITGNGTGSAFILKNHSSNIIIRDCVISNFTQGILNQILNTEGSNLNSSNNGFYNLSFFGCRQAMLFDSELAGCTIKGAQIANITISNCTSGIQFNVVGGFAPGAGYILNNRLSNIAVYNSSYGLFINLSGSGNAYFNESVFSGIQVYNTPKAVYTQIVGGGQFYSNIFSSIYVSNSTECAACINATGGTIFDGTSYSNMQIVDSPNGVWATLDAGAYANNISYSNVSVYNSVRAFFFNNTGGSFSHRLSNITIINSTNAMEFRSNGAFSYGPNNHSLSNVTIYNSTYGIVSSGVLSGGGIIILNVRNSSISSGTYGIFNNATNGVCNLYSNVICSNSAYDLYSTAWQNSYGVNNTCTLFDGWYDENDSFGCMQICTPPINPPVITLFYPLTSSTVNYYPFSFNFTAVDDDSASMRCGVVLDTWTQAVNNSVLNSTLTAPRFYGGPGNHTWKVQCYDQGYNKSSSAIWNFSAIAGTCECYDKATCETALNASNCLNVILMNNVTQNGTFISYIFNFYNKTFDCLGNTITGNGTGSAFILKNHSSNIIIRDCVISNFTQGILNQILNTEGSNLNSSNNGFYNLSFFGCRQAMLFDSELAGCTIKGAQIANITISNCTSGIQFNVVGGFAPGAGYILNNRLSNIAVYNSSYGLFINLSGSGNAYFNESVFSGIQVYNTPKAVYTQIVGGGQFYSNIFSSIYVSNSTECAACINATGGTIFDGTSYSNMQIVDSPNGVWATLDAGAYANNISYSNVSVYNSVRAFFFNNTGGSFSHRLSNITIINSTNAMEFRSNGAFSYGPNNHSLSNVTIYNSTYGIVSSGVLSGGGIIILNVRNSNISSGTYGIFNNATNGVCNLYSNVICSNSAYDLYSTAWQNSYGVNNTCTLFDGWYDENDSFGCMQICTPPINPPVLTITSPSNGSTISYYPFSFNFTAVDDDSVVMRCGLVLDTWTQAINNSVLNNTITLFRFYGVPGLHSWKIECYDSTYNKSSYGKFNFTAVPGTCECYDKGTCEFALNSSVCLSVILMNNVTQNGTFISYLTNFQNKNFSCQNNVITGNGTGSAFILKNHSSNIIIRDCVISNFTQGILNQILNTEGSNLNSSNNGFYNLSFFGCRQAMLFDSELAGCTIKGAQIANITISNCTSGIQFNVVGGFAPGAGYILNNRLSNIAVYNSSYGLFINLSGSGNAYFNESVFSGIQVYNTPKAVYTQIVGGGQFYSNIFSSIYVSNSTECAACINATGGTIFDGTSYSNMQIVDSPNGVWATLDAGAYANNISYSNVSVYNSVRAFFFNNTGGSFSHRLSNITIINSTNAMEFRSNGAFSYGPNNHSLSNVTIYNSTYGIVSSGVLSGGGIIILNVRNSSISSGTYGIFNNATNGVFNFYDDRICYSTLYDLYSVNQLSSSGSNTYCDETEPYSAISLCSLRCVPLGANSIQVTAEYPPDNLTVVLVSAPYKEQFNATPSNAIYPLIDKCRLIGDDTTRQMNFSLSNGTTYSNFDSAYMFGSLHTWFVRCRDQLFNYNNSELRTFTPYYCDCYNKSTCEQALNSSMCGYVRLKNNVSLNGSFVSYQVNFYNKTFDCEGNSIVGNRTGSAIALGNGNYQVTIINCNIRNFTYGIYSHFTSGTVNLNKFFNLNISYTAIGIWHLMDAGGAVANNHTYSNISIANSTYGVLMSIGETAGVTSRYHSLSNVEVRNASFGVVISPFGSYTGGSTYAENYTIANMTMHDTGVGLMLNQSNGYTTSGAYHISNISVFNANYSIYLYIVGGDSLSNVLNNIYSYNSTYSGLYLNMIQGSYGGYADANNFTNIWIFGSFSSHGLFINASSSSYARNLTIVNVSAYNTNDGVYILNRGFATNTTLVSTYAFNCTYGLRLNNTRANLSDGSFQNGTYGVYLDSAYLRVNDTVSLYNSYGVRSVNSALPDTSLNASNLVACFNTIKDINSTLNWSSATSSRVENQCDNTGGSGDWNDYNDVGCTYYCPSDANKPPNATIYSPPNNTVFYSGPINITFLVTDDINPSFPAFRVYSTLSSVGQIYFNASYTNGTVTYINYTSGLADGWYDLTVTGRDKYRLEGSSTVRFRVAGHTCICYSCEQCNNMTFNASCYDIILGTNITSNDSCTNMTKPFDCENNSITGNGTGYGIFAYQNASIYNCTIINYTYGIYSNQSNTSVLMCSFYYNSQGIYLKSNPNSSILNSTFLYNGIGINSSSSNSNITQNKICYNLQDLYSANWGTSAGANNTCDSYDGWNDVGYTGCSHVCDDIPPTVTLISPSNGSNTTITSAILTFRATDNNATQMNCTLSLTNAPTDLTFNVQADNNSLTNVSASGLSNGIHYWNASCTDAAGNAGHSDVWQFWVYDTSAPSVSLISPLDSIWFNATGSKNLSWNVTDDISSTMNCNASLNGAVFNSTSAPNGTTITTPTAGLGEGAYTWDVACTDGSGNIGGSPTWHFTIDSSGPSITLLSPANDSWFNATDALNLTYTVSDSYSPTLSCTEYLDGSSLGTQTVANSSVANRITPILTQGVHYWNVSCTDLASNRAYSETWHFTVDLGGDVAITLLSPANDSWFNATDALNLTYRPMDDYSPTLSCTEYLDGSSLGTQSVVNGSVANRATGTLSEGLHYWNVSCIDRASNVGYSQTWQFTVDLGSPTVTLISPSNNAWFNSASQQNLTYTASDDRSTTLSCTEYLDGSSLGTQTVANSSVANRTTSSLAEGVHYWNVSCTDLSGRTAFSATWHFTIDTEGPSITLISPANNSWFSSVSPLDLTYRPIDDYSPTLSCTEYLDGSSLGTQTVANSSVANRSTGALTQGVHYWNVSCTDLASNTAYSQTWAFTIDSAAPSIELLSPANNTFFSTTGSKTLQWRVTDALSPAMSCNVYLNGGLINSTTVANNTVISTETAILGQGAYYWELDCTDLAGNTGFSEVWKFTITTSGPMVYLQTPPDGSWFNATDAKNLTWKTTDPLSPAMNCSVYLNGALINSTSAANNTIITTTTNSLFQGIYLWNVSCTNPALITGYSQTWQFTIDTTAPSITLISPANNSWFSSVSPLDLTYRPIDDYSPTLSCTEYLDGSSLGTQTVANSSVANRSTGALTQGVHYWNVSCTDLASNTAYSQTWAFTIDSAAPSIELLSPANNTFFSTTGSKTLQWRVTDALSPIMNCNVYLNNALINSTSAANNTIITTTTSSLFQGIYLWNVSCTDLASNAAYSETWMFTIDTAAPSITLISPANNTFFSTTGSKTLQWRVTDALSPAMSCNVYLNGALMNSTAAANNTIIDTQTVVLGQGVYYWNVSCTDAATNAAYSETWVFTITTSGPMVYLQTPADGSWFNVTGARNLTWKATDPLSPAMNCSVYLNGALINSTSAANNTIITTTTSSLFQGIYLWNVSCTNPALITGYSQTWQFTIDTAAPSITLISPANSSWFNSTAALNLTYRPIDAYSPTLSCTEYLDGSSLGAQTVANSSLANRTTSTLTQGVHYWNVSCTDLASNAAYSETWMFTIDTAAPSITLISPANNTFFSTTGSKTLQWRVTDALSPAMSCNVYLNGALMNSTAAANNTIIDTQTVVLGQGVYYWHVSCTDAATNAAYSETWVFTIDSAAPAVTLNSPADGSVFTNPSARNLTWTATDGMDSTLDCSIYLDSSLIGSQTVANNTLSGVMTGSLSYGTHSWNVTCSDDANNTGFSATWSFNITAGSAPTVILVSPTSGTLFNTQGIKNLTWNVTDDSDPTLNCSVYVNNNLVENIAMANNSQRTTSYNAATDGTYYWNVTCSDALNTGFSATWNFLVDSTAPTVTLNSPADGSVFTNPSARNLTWTATDGMDPTLDCSIYLDSSLIGSQTVANNTLSGVMTGSLSYGTHSWNVTCSDDANNTGFSATWSFNITAGSAPTVILVSPTSGTLFNTQGIKNLTWNVTDDSDPTLNCSVYVNNNLVENIAMANNSQRTTSYNAASDGTYYWNVTCSDALNTGFSATWNFLVDSAAPTVTLNSPADGSVFTNQSARNLTWTATDGMDSTLDCSIYLDSSLIGTQTVANGTLSGVMTGTLGYGDHYWNVSCTDDADNAAYSETWQFTVGAVAPAITLLSPADSYSTSSHNIRMEFVAVDGLSTSMNCTLVVSETPAELALNLLAQNNTPAEVNATLSTATHFWRVSCFNGNNMSNVSETWRFTITSDHHYCGDGTVDSNEQCERDSQCGAHQVCRSCQCVDLPYCGDGTCNGNENCSTCERDCGTCQPYCGDGVCNGNETCSSCSSDCGTCPLPPAQNQSGCAFGNMQCGNCSVCSNNTCMPAQMHLDAPAEAEVNTTVTAVLRSSTSARVGGIQITLTDPDGIEADYLTNSTGEISFVPAKLGYYNYSTPCQQNTTETWVHALNATPGMRKLVIEVYVTEPSTMTMNVKDIGAPVGGANVHVAFPENSSANGTTNEGGTYRDTLLIPGKYVITVTASNARNLAAQIDLSPLPVNVKQGPDYLLLLLLALLIAMLIAGYLMRNKIIPLLSGKKPANPE